MASPESLAVANFLKGNPGLKSRTCILQGQRKDLFKGSQPPFPCSFVVLLTNCHKSNAPFACFNPTNTAPRAPNIQSSPKWTRSNPPS